MPSFMETGCRISSEWLEVVSVCGVVKLYLNLQLLPSSSLLLFFSLLSSSFIPPLFLISSSFLLFASSLHCSATEMLRGFSCRVPSRERECVCPCVCVCVVLTAWLSPEVLSLSHTTLRNLVL